MTPGMIGLTIGLAFGVANYVMLRKLAQRVDMPETKKTLNVVAALDLVVMPLGGSRRSAPISIHQGLRR